MYSRPGLILRTEVCCNGGYHSATKNTGLIRCCVNEFPVVMFNLSSSSYSCYFLLCFIMAVLNLGPKTNLQNF